MRNVSWMRVEHRKNGLSQERAHHGDRTDAGHLRRADHRLSSDRNRGSWALQARGVRKRLRNAPRVRVELRQERLPSRRENNPGRNGSWSLRDDLVVASNHRRVSNNVRRGVRNNARLRVVKEKGPVSRRSPHH